MKIFMTMIGLFFSTISIAAPKYGPNATPLSKKTNLEYFKKNPAPDFWALMPYYIGQKSGQQCSAASFTMVLNAARIEIPFSSLDELITLQTFIDKDTDESYKEAMQPGVNLKKLDRSVIGNKHLAEVLKTAIKKLGLELSQTKVELVKIDFDHLDESRKAFHQALIENEKSAKDFIILSAYIQGTLTGDPEGGAHVSPVGAYDAKRKLVLIMDPDRQWYEPYWAPEDKVFDAIADRRADYDTPGYIHVVFR